MKMKFSSLSSGSSGNCQYVETNDSRILIDAGFSGKRVEELLSSIEVCPTSLNGIFVTHEHIDHIKGVGVLSRRFDLPIYANEKTWLGMEKRIGKIKEKNIKIFKTEDFFEMRDISIYPIKVFHDALEPVGFIIYYKNTKISIVTDTGWINNEMISKIKDSDLYLLESNHDLFMLREGLYPWHLKRRIMSEEGHLSNDDAGRILGDVLNENGEVVLLAHLSKDNNVPELAFDTVRKSLIDQGLDVDKYINLGLSHRNKATEVFEI